MLYWIITDPPSLKLRRVKGGEKINKILIAIVTLIVVFGTFTFLGNKKAPMKSQQTTPTATQTNSQVVNVILGDSGFVPKDITVKAGTRVVWINKSGKTATVNSDDHPTHNMYPFLNLGEFPTSSSLQVLFDKTGTYSYHNHNNASDVGTVTVE